MGCLIKKYSKRDIEKYLAIQNALGSFDTDCRNAIDAIKARHPNISSVAARLSALFGTFVVTDADTPLICDILREAADEFENNNELYGVRIAYKAFFSSVMRSLPDLLNYKIEITVPGKPTKYVDILNEDVHDAIKRKGCSLIVSYLPIETDMSSYELSLLLLTRVFSRTDLLNLGVPSIGYTHVQSLGNKYKDVS